MRRLLKILLRLRRPLVYGRRQAIFAGLIGGSRRWLFWGGLAWVMHWLNRLTNTSELTPKYTEDVKPGERLLIVHERFSARETSNATKKARRQQRKNARR